MKSSFQTVSGTGQCLKFSHRHENFDWKMARAGRALGLGIGLQENDLNRSGQRIIRRVDANGQTDLRQTGLIRARTHSHHVKRRLGRGGPPFDFGIAFRLLQELQHVYFGSHNAQCRFVRSSRASKRHRSREKLLTTSKGNPSWHASLVLFSLPRPMTRQATIFALAVFASAFCSSVRAQQTPEIEIQKLGTNSWMEFQNKSNTITAGGGILVKAEGSVLIADTVAVNKGTYDAAADGHVRIQQGDQLWVGEHIRYNFQTHQMVSDQFRSGRSPVFM